MDRSDRREQPGIEPLFRFLYAFACLEDRHYRLLWEALPTWAFGRPLLDLVAGFVAVFVLLFPSNRRAFLWLCAWSVFNLLCAAPEISNDAILLIAMGLWFLGAEALRRRRAMPARVELALASGPAWMFLAVAYMAAALHKLNAGFFDPAQSCADVFVARAHAALPILFPQSLPFGAFLPAGVIALEAALPLLLFFPRTRNLGLLVGVLFHLGVGAVVDTFSTFALACYLLFLPAATQLRLGQALGDWRQRFPAARWGAPAVALIFLGWLFWLGRFGSYELFTLTRGVWFVGAAAALLVLTVWIGRARVSLRENVRWEFRPFALLSAGIALVLAFNSLGPYLGFRSTLAFAMYSNLRVEGTGNHLLVPKGALQVFPEVDDLAGVAWSELPRRLQLHNLEWSVPLLELERRLELAEAMGAGERRIVLAYQGKQGFFTILELRRLLQRRIPFWKRKLFSFREVPNGQVNSCLW